MSDRIERCHPATTQAQHVAGDVMQMPSMTEIIMSDDTQALHFPRLEDVSILIIWLSKATDGMKGLPSKLAAAAGKGNQGRCREACQHQQEKHRRTQQRPRQYQLVPVNHNPADAFVPLWQLLQAASRQGCSPRQHTCSRVVMSADSSIFCNSNRLS